LKAKTVANLIYLELHSPLT